MGTPSDNRISQKANLMGMANIMVAGRCTIERDTTLRADLEMINIGKFCVIAEQAILKPPDQLHEAKMIFLSMSIGDFVIIGKSSLVRAASIGSYCYIGENSIVGSRCVLESCSYILPGTILAQNTVVPPFTVFGGNPGGYVGRLPPSFKEQMSNHCKEFHYHFQPKAGKRGKDRRTKDRSKRTRQRSAASR